MVAQIRVGRGGRLGAARLPCYPDRVIASPGTPRGPDQGAAALDDAALADRLRRHVERLAGDIGERNLFRLRALHAAEDYIASCWGEAGLEVCPQAYLCQGEEVRNLEVVLPGQRPASAAILVGAHYDSVYGSPGANDNGSGVAVLLELARLLSGERLGRSLRLVAFVNEEPPFFRTGLMGSLVYARACRARGDALAAMLCLETVGCYSDAPRSQAYPPPLRFFYPSTASFIALVGNLRSAGLVRRLLAAYRRHARLPAEGAALPSLVPGIGWSDQWAFWKNGYRAVMVTDTAFYRYRHYHTAEDTPDKLDYPRMALLTSGLAAAIRELANVPAGQGESACTSAS